MFTNSYILKEDYIFFNLHLDYKNVLFFFQSTNQYIYKSSVLKKFYIFADLMRKLKSKLKNQKRRSMKKNQSVSGLQKNVQQISITYFLTYFSLLKDDSDASYNGDHSNSSSSDSFTTQQSSNHPKKSYKSSQFNNL